METGAAWALGKPLIPALVHIAIDQLPDPVRRYQARVIETTAQRQSLVDKLRNRKLTKVIAGRTVKAATVEPGAVLVSMISQR
jgi:hypothetical protein